MQSLLRLLLLSSSPPSLSPPPPSPPPWCISLSLPQTVLWVISAERCVTVGQSLHFSTTTTSTTAQSVSEPPCFCPHPNAMTFLKLALWCHKIMRLWSTAERSQTGWRRHHLLHLLQMTVMMGKTWGTKHPWHHENTQFTADLQVLDNMKLGWQFHSRWITYSVINNSKCHHKLPESKVMY